MKAFGVVALLALVMTAGVLTASPDSPNASDVAERARRAARVVVGTVDDAQGVFAVNGSGDRLIVTNVVLRVEETLKGGASPMLQVTVEGGTVGELTLHVSDMPAVARGDRAVFFLDRTSTGTLVPSGRGQGLLKLDAHGRVPDSDLSVEDIRSLVRGASR